MIQIKLVQNECGQAAGSVVQDESTYSLRKRAGAWGQGTGARGQPSFQGVKSKMAGETQLLWVERSKTQLCSWVRLCVSEEVLERENSPPSPSEAGEGASKIIL